MSYFIKYIQFYYHFKNKEHRFRFSNYVFAIITRSKVDNILDKHISCSLFLHYFVFAGRIIGYRFVQNNMLFSFPLQLYFLR